QEHQLDLDTIDTLEDEEVITQLTRIKGIGRWSAEMFLMFRLHRPDVLPVGDLGIVNAIQRQYRLRKRPTPERIRKLAEKWAPYRSVACWYLWRSLDNEPSAAEEGGAVEPGPVILLVSACLLGGRSTVGLRALDADIGVRIPASQPIFSFV